MIRVQPLEQAPHPMQIFYPSALQYNAGVFVIRSGDWRGGRTRSLHPVAAAFAEAGFPAVVADYPGQAADAFEQLSALRRSYEFFRQHLIFLGMTPRIMVFGTGAGAHLGALLTSTAPGGCGEKNLLEGQWMPPAAGAFLSCPLQFTPWPELFPRTWSTMQGIAGDKYSEGSSVYERLSVKNYLKDCKIPLFFAEGEQDHIDTATVSEKVCGELRAAGLPVQWRLYPLGGPSFITDFTWKPSRLFFDDVLRFFKENAGGEVPAVTFPQASGSYGIYVDNPVQPMRGLDLYLPPAGVEVLPTAFFMVHGGGWRAGDRNKFTTIAAEFAKHGVVTASAGYRLQAHNAFEQLADVRAAYEAFVCELERLGRPLQIAVYGESAGAHLASLLAAAQPGECGEKFTPSRQWVRPAAMILQSAPSQFVPWEDISPSILYCMEEIAGAPFADDPVRYERLSLNRHIAADTPATFFSEAEFEAVFPQEMIRSLAGDMKKLGISVKLKHYAQAEHGFFHALELPVQKEFFEDIMTYLAELPEVLKSRRDNPISKSEKMKTQRNNNPYRDIDWQQAVQLQTTSHMHCTSQNILDRYLKAGLDMALFSNYYPSTPWYPLAEIRKDMFRVSQKGYMKDGKFINEVLDCNAILAQWKDELPEEQRKQLPFKAGKHIFTNIPENLLEAPNAEHHFFSDCDTYVHITSPGASITTSVFDRFDKFGMVSKGGIPTGLPLPWRQAYKMILDTLIVKDGGGIVIAHPTWSHLKTERINEMLDFDPRVLGIEVYNHDCSADNTASSDFLWDEILATGRQCYGFFVQDHPTADRQWNGRLVLLAKERTVEAALRAIRQGHFYGMIKDNGLRFEEISFDGTRLYARCNRPVNFQILAKTGVAADKYGATEISFEVKPEDREKLVFLRVTAVEYKKNKIYSNPMILE